MAKGDYLGEFEHIVLLALMRLDDNAYGASIRNAISDASDRLPTIGSVHATLERLERKGLVSSWLGAPTSERGGKAKRHFKISANGVDALKQARSTLDKLQAGLSFRARFT